MTQPDVSPPETDVVDDDAAVDTPLPDPDEDAHIDPFAPVTPEDAPDQELGAG